MRKTKNFFYIVYIGKYYNLHIINKNVFMRYFPKPIFDKHNKKDFLNHCNTLLHNLDFEKF